MRKGSIVPATVYYGGVPMLYVHSLIRTYKAMPNLLPLIANSSARINAARTWNGNEFLASEAEYILLLDTDMAWEPSAVMQLLRTAKTKDAKIVSGMTFMEKNEQVMPHAFRIADGRHLMPLAKIPLDQPFEVDAVGGACLLVHRDVYEAIKADRSGKTAYLWQEEIYDPQLRIQLGEDVVFCKRARLLGYTIWYEPRAPFIHTSKNRLLGPQEYLDGLPGLISSGNVYRSNVQPTSPESPG